MILFGAGSSIPFGVPGMMEFTESFISTRTEEKSSSLLTLLREAISHSEETIGVPVAFDLETLLSVLNDLSSKELRKPISAPTASVLIGQKISLKQAREELGEPAASTLDDLKKYIFDTCMAPIKRGIELEGSFRFLDRFYGPLMTILNGTNLLAQEGSIRDIFSTNWDLCFKTWADYVNLPVNDATGLDRQSKPVFDVSRIGDSSQGLSHVPLHGSLDLAKLTRPKGRGASEDIFRISDPLRYFENKPENIRDLFIIYPMEAMGYEESIKSPYLDMLIAFRSKLKSESILFIIGYSLRDPTIGSILEEAIAERIREGKMKPLSNTLENRAAESWESKFKIVILNPNPARLTETLRRQGFVNLLNTFIPVQVTFPIVFRPDFEKDYSKILFGLVDALSRVRPSVKGRDDAVREIIRSHYGFREI